VWRFVCRCACLQNDFLVCGLVQTLLGPWSKDRPRECATFGISTHNKTEEAHTSQNIACRRSTHGGNSNKEKYGSGARHRKRRYGIEKHWLCLLMDVRRFFVQHNCMEVKYIHGTTLLLSPDPVQIEVCVLLGQVPGICSRHTTLDQVREKRPKMRPAGSLPDKAL
jgi:hypothetical protein